jgi:hypothetical protein
MAFTATICQVYVSGSGNRGCCDRSNSDRANPSSMWLAPLQLNQHS